MPNGLKIICIKPLDKGKHAKFNLLEVYNAEWFDFLGMDVLRIPRKNKKNFSKALLNNKEFEEHFREIKK